MTNDENWQIQELDGTSISDWPTFLAALNARDRLSESLQRPLRVRRTPVS
jgi:hypothetical protein